MQVFDNAGTQEYFIPDRIACTFSFTSITWCYLKFQYFNTLNLHILRECNQTVFYACFLASQKCFQMLQSNKRYEERNIKRIPKKVGVKVMEIKSILIKDTTREERKQIVEESLGIFLQAVMAVWRDWQRCIRNILMVRRKSATLTWSLMHTTYGKIWMRNQREAARCR